MNPCMHASSNVWMNTLNPEPWTIDTWPRASIRMAGVCLVMHHSSYDIHVSSSSNDMHVFLICGKWWMAGVCLVMHHSTYDMHVSSSCVYTDLFWKWIFLEVGQEKCIPFFPVLSGNSNNSVLSNTSSRQAEACDAKVRVVRRDACVVRWHACGFFVGIFCLFVF